MFNGLLIHDKLIKEDKLFYLKSVPFTSQGKYTEESFLNERMPERERERADARDKQIDRED
jgi:hypothetical protein